ncbi:MAG TPA: serine hydrolase domain-containing protein [Phenylobacterium sp.]|nr:serine hydrolase domain-containing protein [Phenylobacterium sp.]
MALRRPRLCALTAITLAGALAAPALAEVKLAKPEEVGFTAAGLGALDAQMRGLVDQQKLAGVTTLVARHGKVVHFDAYGKADLASGKPLQKDAIFRIASMTKPITGVAMMILYEEGKWKLDDPVAKHIPEFANLKVKGPDGQLAGQASPMTMAQLMSHSAGFGVSSTYEGADLNDSDLQGMVDKLAVLPLATQPGTAWDYGPSVNIQGYVVEKLSGQSLDQFFKQRIFDPLKMADTGFWVDPAKAGRVVSINTYKDGKITPADQSARPVLTARPKFLAGSGGLFSTTEDYWRFAQMLANHGELDGARILKPETVKLMYQNVLKPGVTVDLYGPSQAGVGFGMDVAVILDPKVAGTPQGLNTHYWGGAFGTWYWVDPTHDVVFVGMIQNLQGSVPGAGTPALRSLSYPLVYDALVDPAK